MAHKEDISKKVLRFARGDNYTVPKELSNELLRVAFKLFNHIKRIKYSFGVSHGEIINEGDKHTISNKDQFRDRKPTKLEQSLFVGAVNNQLERIETDLSALENSEKWNLLRDYLIAEDELHEESFPIQGANYGEYK